MILSPWLHWQQYPIFNFSHPCHSFVTSGLGVGSLLPKGRFWHSQCYVLC